MSENLAYQEEPREERIDGKVVMMSPRPSFNHNQVAFNIANLFANYLRGHKCTPIADGMDLYLTEENRFVPDFMIVCDPDKIRSTMRNDKTHKKEVYAKCGVREYWLVSPGDKSVEVYRTNGTEFILHDIYALHPDWQLAQMSEEELAALITHFKCSLFDDLDISLERIFYRTF